MPFALYLLALVVFAMGTSEFMLAGLVPDISTYFGVSVGTAGLLTSAFAAGMVIGAPAMAALTRRLPMKATLLGCVIVFALSHVVGALTPDFTFLFITRVIAAIVNAGFLAVALGAATKLVAPDAKGRAVAILLAGTTVATVAGVPAGALLGTALGWQSTFWAIALLCVPAAIGIAAGFTNQTDDSSREESSSTPLRAELAQLASPRLVLTMLLAALVNAGTFATLTFLAPIVTDTAGLSQWWVSVALVLFGVGSFIGVTVAGRLSDARPRLVVVGGGSVLVLGWVALALFATNPVALLGLVFAQGVLGFAVGSTLITRVLYAAAGAPTMAGSYATAALNVGAAAGPVLAAAALGVMPGALGPVWVAVIVTAAALLLAIPVLRLLAPAESEVVK
ncbi:MULTISPECIES: Cmx/CmrA family chloramphenicol efflux MFS transporter [Actinomycetes]|uniref:MFS transporter n=1 Tax=Brevibacterium luteolum TaxID=199591 RepID=A0A6G8KUS7_9MICO|nr:MULTISPECIES: Cmx/CmrA family chloramphenicol efflux MFS transporter [Actinomycetes]QIN28345.1 MFS transporter [Brevibacterium luteolum]TQO22238.1 DHA1 family chloramphenicol resistance protein-like MFS transporter [Microbacterium agarici]TQO23525.1 DHA1 family chloramphenicol resistance protein-like MFS transporter [Microbacterium agarici]TQO23533.1 DHA1 family chloramphenicol resistance protein-like MFS transporter [Microbacterium agarici]UJL54519.1 MFS transporter [Corynebacterium diphth